jgi:hypothetical protein
MSGWRDNDKTGSPGQEAGNRSNQEFIRASAVGKTNHCERSGAKFSRPEVKGKDPSSYRNTTQNKEKILDRLALKQSDSSPVDSFVCKNDSIEICCPF